MSTERDGKVMTAAVLWTSDGEIGKVTEELRLRYPETSDVEAASIALEGLTFARLNKFPGLKA